MLDAGHHAANGDAYGVDDADDAGADEDDAEMLRC